MEGRKRLQRVRRIMLGVGLACDFAEWGTLIYALCTGNWLPFAVGMPVVIVLVVLLVRLYHHETAYLCPACQTKFTPRLGEFFWSRHTPTMRRLTCPNCGERSFCVETYAEPIEPAEPADA